MILNQIKFIFYILYLKHLFWIRNLLANRIRVHSDLVPDVKCSVSFFKG